MSYAVPGSSLTMRLGATNVRFLGGPAGCFAMIVVSILFSVLATVVLNLLL